MKFDEIKMLKVLKFNTLCGLMLIVSSKNLLHIDTPVCDSHFMKQINLDIYVIFTTKQDKIS